jgi:phosphatidylinositol phospholipase C gamma-1
MLVTAPLDKTEKELPSPEKLRRRIILKHKKLPEGTDENAGVLVDLDASKEYIDYYLNVLIID